ncbi:MAG TPA: hypothetical protein VD978_35660 [Azospirillum sp.]|nr:hypothetical protein [Azospirillum sp.]
MSLTLNAATAAPDALLRRVLLADAAVSALMGVVLAVDAGMLAGWLGLPVPLLRWAGVSLLPFAAMLVYLATRPAVPRRAAWAVIAVDALWIVDSAVLLLGGWVEPTALGTMFVIGQAVAVLVFAELTWFGLRRTA